MSINFSVPTPAFRRPEPLEATKLQSAEGRPAPLRVTHYMGTNFFGMTGVETFILQLCAAQKRAGLLPAIAIDLCGREEVRAIAAGMGVEVHDLPSQRPGSGRLPRKLATALLRAQRIRTLARILRSADVLHVHAIAISGLDGFLAAGFRRTAVIVTHHGTLSWCAPRWDLLHDVTFWFEKRTASLIVTPYAAATAEFVARGVPEEQTDVIPFCADEEQFTGIAPMPAPGELTLVMAARMHEGKGQPHLLTAMARLLPRHPGLRLMLIGDGPKRPDVEAEIDRLGLRQVVASKGRVDHQDVPALMRTAHVIVLPSYTSGEMFPVCLLEGMALGLPAIGTRFSGIPDIIEDGKTGILVEPRDDDGLTRAIERFLTEPGFYARARQNALARFRSRYTATVVAGAYAARYAAALKGRGRVVTW